MNRGEKHEVAKLTRMLPATVQLMEGHTQDNEVIRPSEYWFWLPTDRYPESMHGPFDSKAAAVQDAIRRHQPQRCDHPNCHVPKTRTV